MNPQNALIKILAVLLLSASYSIAEDIPLEPVALKSGEFQYFVDDYLVENRFDHRLLGNVRRFLHSAPPEKSNPVLVADKPWEIDALIGPVSVMYDQEHGLFRAYYYIYSTPDKSTLSRLGYAESKNGVNWIKPEFDFALWEGKKTNIIFEHPGKGVEIFQLIDIPESERGGHHMLAYYVGPDGGYLAGSEDGIIWESLQRIVPSRSDCQHNIVYDSRRKEFVIYYRNVEQFKQVQDHTKAGPTRVISRISNPKLFSLWEERPKAVILPEGNDAVLFYELPTTIRDNVYFGFLEQFELYPNETLDVQLCTSRNGLSWKRQGSGDLLIKRGKYGDWNGGMVRSASLVEFGKEWLLYYVGYAGYHGEVREKGASMGLLRFRKEGFVSLRSSDKYGAKSSFVITRPLVWPGGDLQVNFDGLDVFPEAGYLEVQVVNLDRKVIEGFSYEDCETFKGDEVRANIKWKASDITSLVGKEIRLEFKFHNGDLFGFVAD